MALMNLLSPLVSRPRVRGVPYPSACERLLSVPSAVWHVPLQLCLLPALPLQHEGERGDL